jgi:hypothetical protein
MGKGMGTGMGTRMGMGMGMGIVMGNRNRNRNGNGNRFLTIFLYYLCPKSFTYPVSATATYTSLSKKVP